MTSELLDEIRHQLEMIARSPYGYGTLEYSEGLIVTLVRVAYSLHNNCSLSKSTEIVDSVIADLTNDVPKAQNQYVFLCEKEAIPHRKQDVGLLRARAIELIQRTIGREV
ncbi:hypothetical protein [Aquisphaera insulae]|uniref:hypothetical protein n=1 Tax=Aquisphaera insulae TaxID=2712864 RepID=UPI0013EDCDEC|nr:hypothetical protein [Aquisphaera insulae]